MPKELKTVGINPVLVDHLGQLTPINADLYKSEGEVATAIEKGKIVVPDGFAGIVCLEVKQLVDVKEKAAPKEKPAPNPNPAPKAKATETTNVPNA